jgi:hypothetical protein
MHVNVLFVFLMHVLMLIGQGHGKRFALIVVLVLCLVVRRSACYEFLYECNYVQYRKYITSYEFCL